MKRSHILATSIVAAAACLLVVLAMPDKRVDFNTQVKPVLNKNCLACHGGVRQRSGVSFLFPDEAVTAAESGEYPIVPGDPESSEMIRRINHFDPAERMPPDAPPLSESDKRLLKTWIKQGAEWDTHWAYIPPSPDVSAPAIQDAWIRNEVDAFVLQKLRSLKLEPSVDADRSTLARRVSLDLTGLPPTPELAASIINDDSPQAYERFVDTLLASPHFGERWASVWLDLARYADSQGYQKDLLRKEVWRYRDWVIDAFNTDLPFDQFTIEQLAGDLIPNASDNQLLATVFHRNTMTNDEGGTDDEEFRVAAVIDRLNTTFEVWQGTTISCVQCHHHPYDPIRHREYFELAAFFNTTADRDFPNDRPLASLLSPGQTRELASLNQWLTSRRGRSDTLTTEYRARLKAFLAIQPGQVPVMRELPADSSRKTHVFVKGNWLVHGDEVLPDVPDFLPTLSDEFPRNRLGLARWLVDDQNPLTSRVIVNRFWEQLFGRGIVSTLEDFGSQGQPPTHPELLDWLALQFMNQHQWSVKALLKQIVLSATYQQSSATTQQLEEVDPENKYLAHFPRYRLSAEQIRDQALSVSGLLNRQVFGKSVMPFQPEGVWNVIRHAARWETSMSGDNHRRAIYTFWRRVSPYPSMMTFDTPTRELCVSRRIRTNTPLQALVTLNDPVFVEAAGALAERMQKEGGNTVSEMIKYGYRLALVREPDADRLESLAAFYNTTKNTYDRDVASAEELIREVEEYRFRGNDQSDEKEDGGPAIAENRGSDSRTTASGKLPAQGSAMPDRKAIASAETAALINVANVILNLDELIMKN